MKNNAKTKPTKRKILTYYLTMAACLLLVAAVTVGVVFAFKGKNRNDVAVNPPDNPGTNPGGETENPNPKPVDTTTGYVFIVPMKDANLSQAQTFFYDATMDWYTDHEGMDFAAAAGTEVMAAIDGTVTEVSKDDILYGATVTIEHANGITTVYRFIDPTATLKAGAKVNRGDVIGTVASAMGVESEHGDHLHFEVYKNGVMQDPDDYLNINSK